MVRSSKQRLTLGNLRVDKDDLRMITLRIQLWALFLTPSPSLLRSDSTDRTLEPFFDSSPIFVGGSNHPNIQDFAYYKNQPQITKP